MFEVTQLYTTFPALTRFPSATQGNASAQKISQSGQQDDSGERTQAGSTLPGQKETDPAGKKKDSVEISKEADEIRKLQSRDREVRAHEAAHAAVGGAYAGSPSFTFERGPDGQTYAVGGEVKIDVAPVKGDPQATLQKARQVQSAALAPAQPSAQDLKVAQRAQAMAAKAMVELAQQKTQSAPSVETKPFVNNEGESGSAIQVSPFQKTAVQTFSASFSQVAGSNSCLDIHV